MARMTLFADMLGTLLERRRIAPWSAPHSSVEDLCRRLLDAEGEMSGIALAREIIDLYGAMDPGERLSFFRFVNDALELDPEALRELAAAYGRSGEVGDYRAMTAASEPPRQELLRRLNQAQATAELVGMRRDLLGLLRAHPELRRTDLDFVHLLRSWFNRGFLVLRRIDWGTPATILEKIVAYEAVHAIDDWDELRRRVHPPDRRCFAYFHPSMPDEPLIFVQVALTRQVPAAISHLLAEERDLRSVAETRTAVFYSISNCQEGLRGISFGNLLIKQVVHQLSAELPHLSTFVTLSPIPGLVSWLEGSEDPAAARMLAGEAPEDEMRALTARYLLDAKTGSGAPLDPVARFHLGNGALVHAVHPGADPSERGRSQSRGMMVNYLYDLGRIERNHESFVQGGTIAASRAVRALAARASGEAGPGGARREDARA